MLDCCNSKNNSSIIVGDFNFHFDNKTQVNTKKMVNILDTFNLTQSVEEPTHRRGHILDWIAHRQDDNLIESISVSQDLISDHYCVISDLSIRLPDQPVMYKNIRNLRSIDRQALQQDLSLLTPTACPTAELLNSALHSVLDKHAPLVRQKVRPERSAPWYSEVKEELRSAKQQRRKAERNWLRSGLTVFKEIYAEAKKKVACVVNSAKTKFYSSKIADCASSKQLFGIYNHLSGSEKSSPLPTNHSDQDLPNVFMNFFTSKIANIRSDLDKLMPSGLVRDGLGTANASGTFGSFPPVTEDEIRMTINKSKPTTCSLDPVPTPLLLECIDPLLPSITHIVNESLTSGVFPSTYKTAVVKPLLKKTGLNQNILNNFRPVSNLSFLSKIIEKIVLKQIFEYLDCHSLLSPNQSAYRPTHTTETALIKVTNDILLALDRGEVSLLTIRSFGGI